MKNNKNKEAKAYITKFQLGEKVMIDKNLYGTIDEIQISPNEWLGYNIMYHVFWFNDHVKNSAWFYGNFLKKIDE